MRHFPVFLKLDGHRVTVSGAGETAVAKLRLLLKTSARITVFGDDADPQVRRWAAEGRLTLIERAVDYGDTVCSAMLYAANDDPALDAEAVAVARSTATPANIVDNLEDSQFITPAIVDRDPVTVAIGTEGAAPVLARKIKAEVEELLPTSLGPLTRIGQAFRKVAEALPKGLPRRRFWSRFYFDEGPRAFARGEADAVLDQLLAEELGAAAPEGHVHLIGTGPGDPELLTLKARRLLHEADVVIHDRLVPAPILELARREATVIETGKTGFGPSWSQADINALMIEHAQAGAKVARLKSGDAGMFGRLDEETEALAAAGIAHTVTPGITSAAAAAAAIGASLTRRGRNSSLSFITGHDTEGFAEHDWRALAKPGAAAAVYMGIRAAKLLRGRLLMHGAAPETPVTVVENASRPDQRVIATTLLSLPKALEGAEGPAILLYGLAPRRVEAAALEAAQ